MTHHYNLLPAKDKGEGIRNPDTDTVPSEADFFVVERVMNGGESEIIASFYSCDTDWEDAKEYVEFKNNQINN